MHAIQQRAHEIRARLRNPPNAVPDLGIDLKRKPQPPTPEAPVIAQETEQPQLLDIAERISWLTSELERAYEEQRKLSGIYTPKVRTIQEAVCAFTGVSIMDLLSHRRSIPIVRARQIAMYLARNLTLRSLPEIGTFFDNRDHTTVLHGIRKIEKLRFDDERIQAVIDEVSKKLGVPLRSVEQAEAQPCNSTPAT